MTPLMRQYWDIKALHQDKILMFRMGDFFEMFFTDAEIAAPILGIALTQRNKKSSDETPMCGMPHHSIAGPINRLLKAGHRVAICDQIEDPKQAKGIVKRAVTRVLTPGMVYDPDTLDSSISNYLVSIDEVVNDSLNDGLTLAAIDSTTGEAFYMTSLTKEDLERLLKILPIAEIVVDDLFLKDDSTKNIFNDVVLQQSISTLEILRSLPSHVLQSPHKYLFVMQDQVNTQDLYAIADLPVACRRLLSYVRSTGGDSALSVIRPFEKRNFKGRMQLSPTVLRHLEIFSTYKGDSEGSFFQAINRTQTSAGARLFRSWLHFPLLDPDEIQMRLSWVKSWKENPHRLKKLREILTKMGDIERRLSKIAQPQCNGRDLLSLCQSFHAGLQSLQLQTEALQFLNSNEVPTSHQYASQWNLVDYEVCSALVQKIEDSLLEEQPLSTKQGHLLRSGLRADLDELIELSTNSQALIQKMEQEEKEKTGITSLKIRYNNVFGYYIEITNTHKDKAPSHYMRKQTLANAERYCTDELIELEKKVLSSQTRRYELESQIFEELRSEVLALSQQWLRLAQQTAELDIINGLAWLALERKYVEPSFTMNSLRLVASRHPVVEQTVKKSFTPNDILLTEGGILLLTGPNMAGKSTLMRQLALTSILAQIGSFVPADVAELPIFDSIFTRVGASDNLSEGLSTFMVEMTETADMLRKATPKSLLILDEIGRGTSTFDGMSLAQSILEYLASDLKAMTLFATHYHELTVLSEKFPHILNAHMSVVEKEGHIEFLHTLMLGPAQKSYGIQVARLAGVPTKITERAKELLADLETAKTHVHSVTATSSISTTAALTSAANVTADSFATNADTANQLTTNINSNRANEVQGSFFDILDPEKQAREKKLQQLIKQLHRFSINEATPLDALVQISKWQKEINRLDS